MSYILEALKKSQQERELGHVPRLQAVTFDDEPVHAPTHRWVYAALLLAVAAVAIALFAVLRAAPDDSESATIALLPAQRTSRELQPEPSLVPARSADVGRDAVLRRADAVDAAPGRGKPLVQSPVQASASSALQPPAESRRRPQQRQDAIAPNSAAPELIAAAVPTQAVPQSPTQSPTQPPALSAPETVSVQPEVLVVPAPPKPGQPLPRGADELRRAVLGPGSSPSIDTTAPLPLPPAPAVTDSARQQVPEHVPVPADLIADIEAFKKQVGSGPPAARAAQEPVLPPPPRAVPAADTDIALPPPPSVALRGRLPDFRMSVHIYDAEPARRFVYINGRKLRENDKSREGLRLERIVADGAVLSYQGESFFQPR
jgi:general secretion pathway protein B